jgi:hypothetical protein
MKASASFLKKRNKKLLIVLASVCPARLSQMCKSFLLLFFKKEALSSSPLARNSLRC